MYGAALHLLQQLQAVRVITQIWVLHDALHHVLLQLLVIQLPTSLPASLPRRAKVKAEDAGEGDEAPTAEGSYDELSSLRPGKIGKLQIMRSGEVRLVLGDEVLDVDRGVQAQMYQQIVTVDADADELAVLGDVGKKLLCTVRADGVDSDGDGGDAAMEDGP